MLGLGNRLGLNDSIRASSRLGLNDSIGASNRLGLNDSIGVSNRLGLNDRNRVYDKLRLSSKIRALSWKDVLAGIALAVGFVYLFYGSLLLALLLSPAGLALSIFMAEARLRKEKRRIKQQFREGIYALSASVSSGRSVESAFMDAGRDLMVLYPQESAPIRFEFERIVRQVQLNIPLETALTDFSERVPDEDVESFVQVFITAKRTGGNLVEIIRFTAENIQERTAAMDAIEVMILGKQYEQRLLAFLLPLIIIYLRIFSPNFLRLLYESWSGRLVMTAALFLYGVGLYLGHKMTRIEV